jgi:hypothetical protein
LPYQREYDLRAGAAFAIGQSHATAKALDIRVRKKQADSETLSWRLACKEGLTRALYRFSRQSFAVIKDFKM